MAMLPPGADPEELKRMLMGAANGHTPIFQERRRSGWECPVHGPQDQAFQTLPNGEIMWQTGPDGKPSPVAVVARTVEGEGEQAKQHISLHCLACFQKYEKEKMVQEIREHVTRLRREDL